MNSTLVIEEGTKVQTVYGNVIEVFEVIENIVYGYDGANKAIYHISKIIKVVSADTKLSRHFHWGV